MKSKRNFIISCILVFIAGCFSILAWINSAHPGSITMMFIAAVIFMTGVIIFVLNFKE